MALGLCVSGVRAMHCCLLFKLNFSIEMLGERLQWVWNKELKNGIAACFSFCFYIFVLHIIITLAHTKFLFEEEKTFIVFYSVIKCLCVKDAMPQKWRAKRGKKPSTIWLRKKVWCKDDYGNWMTWPFFVRAAVSVRCCLLPSAHTNYSLRQGYAVHRNEDDSRHTKCTLLHIAA